MVDRAWSQVESGTREADIAIQIESAVMRLRKLILTGFGTVVSARDSEGDVFVFILNLHDQGFPADCA